MSPKATAHRSPKTTTLVKAPKAILTPLKLTSLVPVTMEPQKAARRKTIDLISQSPMKVTSIEYIHQSMGPSSMYLVRSLKWDQKIP